jgi:hypothetical protein
MKWSNLKQNKCPKCDKDFMIGLKQEGRSLCTIFIHPCGFKIRELRWSQIVNNQITQDLEDKWNKEEEEATNL